MRVRDPRGYPLWHKINVVQKWSICTIVSQFNDFLHSALSLAQTLTKPYPFWHTFGVQNPSLSGKLLENPTLCGTEVGQNGTLAVLAYAYHRKWECPPGYVYK